MLKNINDYITFFVLIFLFLQSVKILLVSVFNLGDNVNSSLQELIYEFINYTDNTQN